MYPNMRNFTVDIGLVYFWLLYVAVNEWLKHTLITCTGDQMSSGCNDFYSLTQLCRDVFYESAR